MATKIKAEAISFTDDGECSILGFADNAANPVFYVMLQVSNHPNKEEIAFGWAGVHIDTGTLGVDGHDLVQDISETRGCVTIKLTSDVANQSGVDQDIEIELAHSRFDHAKLNKAIQVFKKRLNS